MSVHKDTAIKMAEERECSYYFKNIIDLIRGTLRHNPYMLNHYCTYTLPQDVTITVDDDFTQIILTGSCEWEFTIIVADNSHKLLTSVFLTSGDMTLLNETEVFHLQLVHVEGQEVGCISNNKWMTFIQDLNTYVERNPKRYSMKVKFKANNKGVYRANLFLHFGQFPIIFVRLCVDYTQEGMSINRFTRMKTQQLSLISKRWKGPHIIHKDFVDEERTLSCIYPYPDERSFFITHDSDKNTAVTKDNYRGRLHELISLEEIAKSHLLSGFDQTNVAMHVDSRSLVSVRNVNIYVEFPNENLLAKIRLNCRIDELMKSGSLVLNNDVYALLKRNGSSHILKVPIVKKSAQFIYAKLDQNCLDSWSLKPGDEIIVDVRFALSRRFFCHWHWAADCANIERLLPNEPAKKIKVEIIDNLILDDLLQIQINNVTKLSLTEPPKILKFKTVKKYLTKDPIQKQAANAILCPNMNPLLPIVIKGYAGTGKKKVIVTAIKKLLEKNCKILLCTSTDHLADYYITEYFDDICEDNMDIKLFRLYDSRVPAFEVDRIVLKYCRLNIKNKFIIPNNAELQNYNIIVTTLHTISYETNINFSITHLIIEEASMIAEWELLILLVMAKENTRLIIVGDKFQSKPKIYSTVHNMSESILDKFYDEEAPDCKNNPYLILMNRVHRMNPKITHFLNRCAPNHFQVVVKKKVRQHSTIAAMTFYAVYGDEEEENDEGLEEAIGYKNDKEAEELVKRVLELKNTWPSDIWGPFNEQSIGVFTCFTAQVHNLRNKLKCHGISVNLVSDIARLEYMAVFISTVRSSRNRKIFVHDDSFVTNPRLMYIAMSRAKEAVAVVGDPKALSCLGYDKCRRLWKNYFKITEWCRKGNS